MWEHKPHINETNCHLCAYCILSTTPACDKTSIRRFESRLCVCRGNKLQNCNWNMWDLCLFCFCALPRRIDSVRATSGSDLSIAACSTNTPEPRNTESRMLAPSKVFAPYPPAGKGTSHRRQGYSNHWAFLYIAYMLFKISLPWICDLVHWVH